MSLDFKLPELGENVESGDVVRVLVGEGDRIEANQSVLELETDKAVVEIPCPHAGTVTKVHFAKGDTIEVGTMLLTLEPDDAVDPANALDAAEQASPVGKLEEPERSPQAVAVPTGSSTSGESLVPAGPSARRLARELGVDLRGVSGSGARGRITDDDVRNAAKAGGSAEAASHPSPSSSAAVSEKVAAAAFDAVVPPGEPDEDAWGPVRREPMSRIRKTIAAQMVRAASTIPHVTNFDDADVTDLEHFRKGVQPGFLGPGLRLTAMPFVLKATALALTRHPLLNASFDEEDEAIVYHEYVNLGVAVDTPRGLVVPVIRGVDRMSIPRIARSLAAIAGRARAAKFTVDDLRGGTFSISNLGAVGGTYSTPIINHPEVAILLAGRSRWMPVVRDGSVHTRLMMPLSLSYDHRLVDGAAAARFLNEVIDHLQSLARLVLAE